MEIYPKSTYLNVSDRYVLNKYGSEFYEFSPECISGKRILNNDKVPNFGNNVSNGVFARHALKSK